MRYSRFLLIDKEDDHYSWVPTIYDPCIVIEMGKYSLQRDHLQEIAVPWTPDLRTWHLHDIVKDAFGYLDRNRIALNLEVSSGHYRVLEADEIPPPGRLKFSCWPAPVITKTTWPLVEVYFRNGHLWREIKVPPDHVADDVWAGIATDDPFALANDMKITWANDRYYVTWS
jgi:hypothetical protein